MCRVIMGPNERAGIELIEINREKANKLNSEPGFMFLLYKPRCPGSGYRREEIKKIVLWQNASHGYLGLNYRIWPWWKKLAAHGRILVCWLDRLQREDSSEVLPEKP